MVCWEVEPRLALGRASTLPAVLSLSLKKYTSLEAQRVGARHVPRPWIRFQTLHSFLNTVRCVPDGSQHHHKLDPSTESLGPHSLNLPGLQSTAYEV